MSMVAPSFASPLFSLDIPHCAGKLCDVAWSPSGTHLAAVTSTGWVFLWDSQTGEMLQQKQVTRAALLSVTWAREGTCLAVGGQDGVVRFLDECFLVCSTYPFAAPIKRIAWAPHVVGACVIVTGQQVTVLREDARSTRALRYRSVVLDASWSSDGRQLAILCVDGLIEIWLVRQARLAHRFSTEPLADGSILWDQACRTIIVADGNGSRYSYPLLEVHPFLSSSPISSPLPVVQGRVGRPTHDPSGQYLATAYAQTIHLYALPR